eukprot:TRINITY_DN1939_c1_g1_i1.p1 TRINITY_DN1939_c1_g1~~TRINITY_DN1939_c1_g1_i1.p1  ORF type:complete len:200 (-),score=42.58 TRINITY_DN1939_c1_g1_i1:29-628(-)
MWKRSLILNRTTTQAISLSTTTNSQHTLNRHSIFKRYSSSSTNGSDGIDKKEQVIKFYKVEEQYGYLSNFAPYPIKCRGKIWPTSEHFFQSMKFEGTPDEERIRNAKTPQEAFDLARSLPNKRVDWKEVREEIMRESIRAKFTQHKDLHKLLIDTHPKRLVEDSKDDKLWGGSLPGSQNRFGFLLEEFREKLLGEKEKR